MRLYTRAAVALALVVLGSTPSHPARADGFDGQRFVPAAGAAGGFVVERAAVPEHLGLGFGLFLHYGLNPVVEVSNATGEVVSHPLADALTFDFLASIGLFDRFELAVLLPVSAIYDGDGMVLGATRGAPGAGLHDLRLMPKLVLLGGPADAFSLGLAAPVTLPIGDPLALRGIPGVSVEPRLLLAFRGRRFSLQVNGGYRIQSGTAPPNLPVGNEITFGAGATIGLAGRRDVLDLAIEAFGGLATSRSGESLSELPLEALVGVIIKPDPQWGIYLGGGLGLTDGIGAPDLRAVLGVRFTPAGGSSASSAFQDQDGDGIGDAYDRCPSQPEDEDGFQDGDGCPEADNDHDGIPDDEDECPDLAEEPGGDRDGCPDRGKVIVRDGKVYVIGNVQFETGSARIKRSSERMLDDVAEGLKAHPEIHHIEIQGHTDNVGGKDMNMKLSGERAESVRHALEARGIARNRMQPHGYGETRPLAPNKTRAGRAKNRRVEFVLGR